MPESVRAWAGTLTAALWLLSAARADASGGAEEQAAAAAQPRASVEASALSQATAPVMELSTSTIERGRYLTTAADCAACHEDPVQLLPFAGGKALDTPFGKLVGPNITPDRETGIGAMSDDDFDSALRHGVSRGNKRLYPAMPFVYFTQMSRDEVLAIRAYLKTIPAVHNAVQSNQLPFPFSVRASMLLWDGLFFTEGEFKPNAAKSPAWNRGAFLMLGPGHCAACHTPKNLLGADKTSDPLQGYTIEGWFAPNLTTGPLDDSGTGLSDWSAADFAEYLRKGHNRFAAAAGPMAEVVDKSTSRLSASDLDAIAEYLKDQHAEATTATPEPNAGAVMTAGAAIYQDACSACHAGNGTGVAYLIPNLAAANSVAERDATTVIRVILEGSQSVATREEPTAPAMPSFAWQLNDAEVAAVATYIGNSWGHAEPAITERAVREARSKLAKH